MSWSPTFLYEISKQSCLFHFELRFLDLQNNVGSAFSVFSSGNAPLKIGAGGVSVAGVKVIPSRWSVSFGGFSVQVVGDPTELFQLTTKGSFAEVWCKVNYSNWERIAIGQLHNITKQGIQNSFLLQFNDIISALQNRTDSNVGAFPSPTQQNPPRQDLFYEAGFTYQLSQNWNVGDSFMYFSNVDRFRREAGSHGVVKVQANSSSAPFFLEFAAVDSSNLRIDTTPNSGNESFPSFNSAYNLSTSSGSFATICVQIDDHPSAIFGKLITSTGTGNNGSLDTLPLEWSVGGYFDEYIFDRYDAEEFSREVLRGKTSKNYSWRFITDAPFSSGVRDLISLAAAVGQFPVMRQGKLSWRGCSDPEGNSMNYDPIVAGYIEDHDIIQVTKHEMFDPQQQGVKVISSMEYTTDSTLISNTFKANSIGRNSGSLPSFPASPRIDRSTVTLYSPDQDQQDMVLGDIARIANWDHYTWEKITLRCTMRTAQFVAGDIVEVTSKFLRGLKERSGFTFQSKRCMILSSQFDFSSNSSVIILGCISGNN